MIQSQAGRSRPRKPKRGIVAGLALAGALCASVVPLASADTDRDVNVLSTKKIVNNGPDGEKLVMAVLGDGYTKSERRKFEKDARRLLVDGVLEKGLPGELESAFNVYLVTVVSEESGIRRPGGTKKTALGLVYNGQHDQCWMQKSAFTDEAILAALEDVPKFDHVMVILNEESHGGCKRGLGFYVTSGAPESQQWIYVAHEFGHEIADLFDEYALHETAYAGGPVRSKNCSTVSDPEEIHWSGDIPSQPTAPVHRGNPVGVYEGCMLYASGIYRPIDACRMRFSSHDFCPICSRLLRAAIEPFTGTRDLARRAAATGAATHRTSLAPPAADAIDEAAGAGPRAVPVRRRILPPDRQDPARGSPESPSMGPTPPAGSGGGEVVAEPERFLSLIVRVSTTDNPEILRVREVEGRLQPRVPTPGGLAYAMTRSSRRGFTSSLAQDPFIVRGFPEPGASPAEHYSRTESAEIVINVPYATAQDVIDQKLGLSFFGIPAEATIEDVARSFAGPEARDARPAWTISTEDLAAALGAAR